MSQFLTRDGWAIRDVYIDETSQTKHQYLILGGITVPKEVSNDLTEAIVEARNPELPNGEMRWGKVSRTKLPAYTRVIDAFFAPPWVDLAHFHALVVDTTQQDHARYNQGSGETGFCKEVYQLAQKFRRLYTDCVFHIYPDQRNTPQPTEELRLILNRGSRKSGDQRPWPFRRVHFRKSHECQMLQLTDVLLGALAYLHNGHNQEPDASPAKKTLAEHPQPTAWRKTAGNRRL